MSATTCSKSWPRVSTRPAAIAQYMKASSGSGLWPTRTRISRAAAGSALVEEPPLQLLLQLGLGEGPHPVVAAVVHVRGRLDVRLQRLVGREQGVAHLVALEQQVLLARRVRLALVEVDGPADRPDPALLAIDPQRDPLRVAAIVAAHDHPLGVPVAVRVTLLHRLPPRSVSRGGD